MKPHTLGHHEVLWFPHTSGKENPFNLADTWSELLRDAELITGLEKQIQNVLRGNPSLRAYAHDTVRNIQLSNAGDVCIPRTIQSIPQPHLHIAEGFVANPQGEMHYLNLDRIQDLDKFLIIANHSQELFADLLQEVAIACGERVQYTQEVGVFSSINLTRTVFGMALVCSTGACCKSIKSPFTSTFENKL